MGGWIACLRHAFGHSWPDARLAEPSGNSNGVGPCLAHLQRFESQRCTGEISFGEDEGSCLMESILWWRSSLAEFPRGLPRGSASAFFKGEREGAEPPRIKAGGLGGR